MKKISFIGLGKLGLPLATCFAKNSYEVLAIDKNKKLIDTLKGGKAPWKEPRLADNISLAEKTITYSTSYAGVEKTDVSIILVNTPSVKKDGSFSNLYVEQSIKSICDRLNIGNKKKHHIILSSTVMPGSIKDTFIPLIKSLTECDVTFNYVPDFVAIGKVIDDFEEPDFLLIGGETKKSINDTRRMYKHIMKFNNTPVREVNLAEAELCKVALNAYITTKISFGNYLGILSKRLDPSINVDNVTNTIGLDSRIGLKYLTAGGPYGGTCFPRDTWAFAKVSNKVGLESFHMMANEKINDNTDEDIFNQIISVDNSAIGLVGLGFKPGTPVTTEGVASKIIRRLKNHKAKIYLFDIYPEAIDNIIAEFPEYEFVDSRKHNFTLRDIVDACNSIVFCNGDKQYLQIMDDVDFYNFNTKNVIDPWRII